jgi:hypothetical protein
MFSAAVLNKMYVSKRISAAVLDKLYVGESACLVQLF